MGQGKKKKIKGPSTTNTPPMVLECILFFFLFPPLSQQKSSPFFQVSLSLSEENVSNLFFFSFSLGNENQPLYREDHVLLFYGDPEHRGPQLFLAHVGVITT